MNVRYVLFGLVIAAQILQAHPEVDENLKIIPLHHGTNAVNLDGQGLMATVMIARRDNFNAHSVTVTTIYATLRNSKEEDAELKIVPVLREDGSELLNLSTGGGADCVLRDYRLLADPMRQSAVLITADRKFGSSFADEQRVTFERYRLMRNADGVPGFPALYFKFEKRWESAKAFCDVNDAFEDELKIPRSNR